MSWNLSSDRPVFMQIVEHIELDIVSGKLPPGAKFPSVRDLAAEAAVNPNTMQRALSELERKELLRTDRTVGRFVTYDKTVIERHKKEIASSSVSAFIIQMKKMGLDKDEVCRLINENYQTDTTKEEK
ncbi:MAG: GntR family transcriptional regulator [Lachnospiraceae bacterium]|nr:GntR family transcriptional regulator [Lachnospiraceae bacterium]